MILLLDSSTSLCRLTLVDDNGKQIDYSWQADRQLAHQLLGYLRDRLAEHDQSFLTLTGIGVMKGPGSFTGLRIGITVLNTLAHDRQIPIVGTSGDHWIERVLQRLSAGEDDKLVMPEYGAPVNITQPRK